MLDLNLITECALVDADGFTHGSPLQIANQRHYVTGRIAQLTTIAIVDQLPAWRQLWLPCTQRPVAEHDIR